MKKKMLESSWRRSEPVERDLLPPAQGSPSGSYTSGWDYLIRGHHGPTVYRAWSTYLNHGDGPEPKPHQGSYGRRDLYSTEERALRAMRRAIEDEALEHLTEIDRKLKEIERGQKLAKSLVEDASTDERMERAGLGFIDDRRSR